MLAHYTSNELLDAWLKVLLSSAVYSGGASSMITATKGSSLLMLTTLCSLVQKPINDILLTVNPDLTSARYKLNFAKQILSAWFEY